MTTRAYAFNLNGAVIAPWTNAQTWGAAIAIDAINMYSPVLNTVADTLLGDGGIAALAAAFIGGKIDLEFGVKNLNVFGALSGLSEADSSPTSESLVITQQNLPYFGINGQIKHDTGAGAYEFFIPKCKIMGDLSFTLQYGKFWTQRVSAQFVADSVVYGMAKIISRATAASPLTIPPA